MDLTGINTEGEFGDAGNESGTLCFPSGVQLDVLGFSVEDAIVNPNGASWCEEASIAFGATVGISPATGQDNPGPCLNPHNIGFTPLSAGLDFPTDAVGCFPWEGYETFNDGGPDPDQTFGGGTITLYGCPSGVALPIELIAFKGKVMNDYNLITWTTAIEVDSRDHIIEMSINGRDNWKEVGRVTPAGNSLEAKNYSLKDMDPRAITYYRLKEVSFDDKVQYSDIIVLERTRGAFAIANLYPVPVSYTHLTLPTKA